MTTKSKYSITGVKNSHLRDIIDTFYVALEQKEAGSYVVQDYGVPNGWGYNLKALTLMFADDIFPQGKKAGAPAFEDAGRETCSLPQNSWGEGRDWAEQRVNIWEDDSDPVETVTIDGEPFRLRRSEQKEAAYMAAVRTAERIYEQKFILGEREFLRLMLTVKDMKSKPFPLWHHPKTEADRRMYEEFKRHLAYKLRL